MKVFVSYRRGAGISQDRLNKFKRHLEDELGALAADAQVFVDTEMPGGTHFPDELVRQLEDADVLLVMLTPAWLQSNWCRREFDVFTRNIRDRGRVDRVLPLLWAQTPDMSQESHDQIARSLANILHADWTDKRHKNFTTMEMRREFAKRAIHLTQVATTCCGLNH